MNGIKLLLLNCSPRRDNSTSRHFTRHLLPAMSGRLGRDVQIVQRDLGADPLPALTADYADAQLLPVAAARARFGEALATTERGKVGLLRDRPTVIAVTSGGAMFREPAIQPDFFRPYLSAVLGVI